MENFFDYIIVFAPIIGYIPQIYKVIKNKSDIGFNTNRVSILFNSVIIEFFLNFAFNLKKKKEFTFHNYARTISLLVCFIGIIIKIIIKTKYSHNIQEMIKHNIINVSMLFIYSCVFLPIILLTSSPIIIILSILSTILNFCNYLPQIYETYKIKKSGSLSYTAVIFDFIGCIVIFIYMITNNQNNFLLLFPILIVNITIIIQLCLMYYYDRFLVKKSFKKYNKMIELVEIYSDSKADQSV